ncbi:MAG: arginine--tRNA ligase, partial [Planctomycetota bacterium]
VQVRHPIPATPPETPNMSSPQSGDPFRQEVIDRISAHAGVDASIVDGALTRPPKANLGDFAFPCFTLAKQLKKAPPQIAADIAEKISGESNLLSSAVAAGPYVNISVHRDRFAEHYLRPAIQAGEDVGQSDEGNGKVVAIDYCSPNIAKPFHVGHLRSTIIGAALHRLYTKLGYTALGINHLGDWGTQFGKQIVGLKRWGTDDDINDLMSLNRLYVQYHDEEKKDADLGKELGDESRAWFRKQEEGDEEALELWRQIRQTSLDYLGRIFDRLGVSFEHTLGESFYNDKMDAVLKEATEKGITSESDGALIIDLNDAGIETPALLRKADGATLYMTRDLAAALYRKNEFNFDRMIYVVGTPQSLHFKQLFTCIQKLGYDWADECVHVNFGQVMGMATRKGNVVYLEDLLNEARDRSLKFVQEHVDKRSEVDDEEAVAEAVGLAAIVFNDLVRQRHRDYQFDWDNAISFEGDTGPYLLNAYARIAGILRKSGVELDPTVDFSSLSEDEAHVLVREVSDFPRVLRSAAETNEPSVLAGYLLELARALHSAYSKLRVKGEEESVAKARLLLFTVVKNVLGSGMRILGMTPLERM